MGWLKLIQQMSLVLWLALGDEEEQGTACTACFHSCYHSVSFFFKMLATIFINYNLYAYCIKIVLANLTPVDSVKNGFNLYTVIDFNTIVNSVDVILDCHDYYWYQSLLTTTKMHTIFNN